MESEAIIEKCENLAKSDVLDLFFTDPYNLMKSLTAFKKQSKQLCISSYRAQLVILNGLLIENIGTIISGNSLKNIEVYLSQLDRLVAKSSTLQKSPELDEVQKYARSLLYHRLGDFILISMKSKNIFDEDTFMLALCAYAIALDHLKKSALSSLVSMEAAEIFNIIELYIILKSNLTANNLSKFQTAINDEKLGRKLIAFFAKPEHSSSLQIYSFIVSDASHRTKMPYEIPAFNLDILMPKLWVIRHTYHFFERLLWLVSKELVFNGTLPFINAVSRLKHFPKELRISGVESFTLFDLKIALLRMSKYVYYDGISPNRLDSTYYPYLAYVKPSSVQKKFWESCLLLIDDSLPESDILSSIRIMTALEEIRLRKENYDTLVLFSVFRWLKNFFRTTRLTENDRAVVFEMTERYALSLLNSMNHILIPKAPDSIFVSLYANFDTNVVEDDAISEEVCIFLAEIELGRKNFRGAETYLLSISNLANDSETLRNVFFKMYSEWALTMENATQKEQYQRLAERYKNTKIPLHRLSDVNSSYLSDTSFKTAFDDSQMLNGRFSPSSFITPTRNTHANETTPSSVTSELQDHRSACELEKAHEAAELNRILISAIQQGRQLIELMNNNDLLQGLSLSVQKESKDIFKTPKLIKKQPKDIEFEVKKEASNRLHEHFCCGTDSEQEEVFRILDNRANTFDF